MASLWVFHCTVVVDNEISVLGKARNKARRQGFDGLALAPTDSFQGPLS